MNKIVKYVLTVILPFVTLTGIMGACASTSCNNDACYDRNLASVDPFHDGDVAAWGKEKQEKDKEDAREKRLHREFNRQ